MMTTSHHCIINRVTSGSFLPDLPEDNSWWRRKLRAFRKEFMVSSKDPRVVEYYRTKTGILNERKRHAMSGPFIIHPFSNFKLGHEMVITLFLLLTYVGIPYLYSFWPVGINDHANHKQLLTLLNCVFIPDIFLQFFMGYIDEKNKRVVMEPIQITKHYVFGPYFIFDVLSSLPTELLEYAYSSKTMQLMHVMRFIKIVRLKTFFEYTIRIAKRLNFNKIFINLMKFIVCTSLLLHWSSCLFYFVPHMHYWVYGHFNNNSWIVLQEVYTKGPTEKYVRCLFQSGGVFAAAHAGLFSTEIQAIYPYEEMVLAMAVMTFGKIYLALAAVIWMNLVCEIYTLETKFQGIMNQLDQYMRNKKLPLTMRERLVQYYDHKYQNKYFKEKIITAILSENLRKEVNINVCKQLVKSVSLFSELPPKIISDILGNLKGEVFLPNDIIIKAGSTGDCMYFLASGTVAVFTPSGREVCHLEDGAHFGEIALILKENTKRVTDVIALDVCEVFRLDKRAFRACFKNDKSGVFEKMQGLAAVRLERTSTLEENYKLELFHKAYLGGAVHP